MEAGGGSAHSPPKVRHHRIQMQTLGSLSPTNFLCQEMQTAKHCSVGYFMSRLLRGMRPARQRPATIRKHQGLGRSLLQADDADGWLHFIFEQVTSQNGGLSSRTRPKVFG